MKFNVLKNNKTKFITKPLVISNDNFILDGHHRWFTRKNLIENNTNNIIEFNSSFSEEISNNEKRSFWNLLKFK